MALRAILVDDEHIMRIRFEIECSAVESINLVEVFSKPQDAIDYVAANEVDVAFLDVEMPAMNGLELSDRLREIYPDLVVIFISAYESYMIDAIGHHQADYFITKPYSQDDIVAVCERARLLSARQRKKVSIKTFGSFRIYVDGEPLVFASAKAKEIVAILVDRRGEPVSTSEAYEMMWEGKHYDHTQAAAYRRALSKLQNTLEEAHVNDILEKYPHARAIKCDRVDCDYFDFLSGDSGAIDAYKGEYMSEYSWGEYTRARLDRKKLQLDPDAADELYDW